MDDKVNKRQPSFIPYYSDELDGISNIQDIMKAYDEIINETKIGTGVKFYIGTSGNLEVVKQTKKIFTTMSDNIYDDYETLYEKAYDVIKTVTEKHDVVSYHGFTCPFMQSLAEEIGFFDDNGYSKTDNNDS
jgi:hypothetical protein